MFASLPQYTATPSTEAVTLEDIYNPTEWNNAIQERAIERNNFLMSGIMVNDPQIAAMASGPGTIGDLPFYLGLTNDEPDYTNDNPAATSTPASLGNAKMVFATAHQHKSWSMMDLAREVASQDPVGAITGRIGKYWSVSTEKRVINSSVGLFAGNIANNSGDMINAIHTETGDSAVAANLASAAAIIGAAATLGDHSGELAAIAMHSVVYHNLQALNLISTVRDIDNNVAFDLFLGKYRVVVDDGLPVRAGTTNGLVYTTILFSAGSFAYGAGTPLVPSEIERIAGSGNGGGQDVIHARQTEIIHPLGFAFSTTGIAGITATYAELAAAAQWNRVYAERKNVGIAFLTSNG